MRCTSSPLTGLSVARRGDLIRACFGPPPASCGAACRCQFTGTASAWGRAGEPARPQHVSWARHHATSSGSAQVRLAPARSGGHGTALDQAPSQEAGEAPAAAVGSQSTSADSGGLPSTSAPGAQSSSSSSGPGNSPAGSSAAARTPGAAQLPAVALCHTIYLPVQVTQAEAVQALKAEVQRGAAGWALYPSGAIRIEVPVPRGCTALRWLKGQPGGGNGRSSGSGDSAPPFGFEREDEQRNATAADAALPPPCVYFSGRRSSAPDTPGAAAAEAHMKAWSAVAGLGAAWLWHGPSEAGFGAEVVYGMQRFLSSHQPRIKILGGTRFDPLRPASDEWRNFGAYCFLLPLLEYLEDADHCALAVTLAWDVAVAAASAPSAAAAASQLGRGSPPGSLGCGAADAGAAAAAALSALDAVLPPATLSAHALQITRTELEHVPLADDWTARIQHLLQALEADDGGATDDDEPLAGGAGGSRPRGAARRKRGAAVLGPLGGTDVELARQSYVADGQQGLDDLLAALNGGSSSGASGTGPTSAGSVGTPAAPEVAALSKVVLARRSALEFSGEADPLWILEALQERDPRSYQLMLRPPGGAAGNGGVFVSSTPERLYARTGTALASEAVAGTRPRGPPGDLEADFYLSLDLLRSAKDHAEFCCVRDWIRDALGPLCEGGTAQVEVPKSVLKQGALQHLYGRLAGRLLPDFNDAHVLAALHPTPAVCGRPREQAMTYVAGAEQFDRGFYAGPFGWISGAAAEFVVAIRSALVCDGRAASPALAGLAAGLERPLTGSAAVSNKLAYLYAGVGVVKASDPQSEWQELDLKVRQYQLLVRPGPPLAAAPNINAAWCRLLVEELCRQGATMFCVAPGSRSSALALAAASHPRARLNIGIDERSLGFWALGYSRATGLPAVVITSSGTAVANLLPAVIEASLSHLPLLMITADRPTELRDTGANQTIDQVKIFGGFTRWFQDLSPPVDGLPGRMVLTSVDAALRHAGGAGRLPPGPVHLNMQFREPLAPTLAPWDAPTFLQALGPWQSSQRPYSTSIATAAIAPSPTSSASTAAWLPPPTPELRELSRLLRGARRGLLVVGELTTPTDVAAAARLSRLLGWPVVADVLSGLRVGVEETGGTSGTGRTADQSSAVIHSFDHLLLGELGSAWWSVLRPDVILQLGPRLTSKRIGQFLEWSAQSNGADAACPWIYVGPDAERHDGAHLVTHRATMSIADLHSLAADALQPRAAAAVRPVLPSAAAAASSNGVHHAGSGRDPHAAAGVAALSPSSPARQMPSTSKPECPLSEYARMLLLLDGVVSEAVDGAVDAIAQLSEPFVARELSRLLPQGHGLYLGNSMPIRDMDQYSTPRSVLPAGPPSSSDGGLSAPWATSAAAATTGLGVPVGANRGASGIDGVLSTAAGFAEGLGRPATLLIGDISFIHDSNGLGLLRGGEARPPLTVLLVNNSGGGIFNFLPIAGAVPSDVFAPLWATPQSTDLECLCRAHGIPHQRVTSREALGPALRGAWGLNRHSVVEAVTDRSTNVGLHRRIQAAALQAAQRAHLLLTASQSAPRTERWLADAAAVAPLPPSPRGALLPALVIQGLSWQRYSLPLAMPLTTAAGASSARDGILLRITLLSTAQCSAGSAPRQWHGLGEVAPLPGLHPETLQDSAAHVGCLAELLRGVALPRTLPMLGGRLSRWWRVALGVDPDSLPASVRFGVETALLDALAAARSETLSDILFARAGASPTAAPGTLRHVSVNGLVSGVGSVEQVAAEAAALAAKGYTALKVKVGRRSEPLEDAAALLAVRAAVGPAIVLRADANQRWTFDQATEFGCAVAAAGLQYVEEPLADPWGLPDFFRATGIPFALDETLEAGRLPPSNAWPSRQQQPLSSLKTQDPATGSAGPNAVDRVPLLRTLKIADSGLAALVVKPTVLGSYEAVEELAAWAAPRGVQLVLSSAFESSLGVAHLVHLAAALDHSSPPSSSTSTASSAALSDDLSDPSAPAPAPCHGLGTLRWFARDVVDAPLAFAETATSVGGSGDLPRSEVDGGGGAAGSCGVACSVVSAQAVVERVLQQWALGDAALHSESDAGAASASGADAADTENGGRNGHLGASGASNGASSSSEGDSRSGSRSSSSSGTASGEACLAAAAAAGSLVPRLCSRTCSVATAAGSYSFHLLEMDQPAAGRTPCSSSVPDLLAAPISTRLSPTSVSEAVRGPLAGSLVLHPLDSTSPEDPAAPAPPPSVLLLHGFLGRSDDWRPLMHGLAAAGSRCIAVDVPGHGGTSVAPCAEAEGVEAYALPAVADALARVVQDLGMQGCVLVGYSLGARLALTLALRHGHLFSGAALLSGSPGIQDLETAATRACGDDALAAALRGGGLPAFVDMWYTGPLWSSLRCHPRFSAMLARRRQQGMQPSVQQLPAGLNAEAATPAANEDAAEGVALALSGMSTGRMPHLWADLPACSVPLLLLSGEWDVKFTHTNQRMLRLLTDGSRALGGGATRHAAAVVPGAGHALHEEQPLATLSHLRQFLLYVSSGGVGSSGSSGNVSSSQATAPQ